MRRFAVVLRGFVLTFAGCSYSPPTNPEIEIDGKTVGIDGNDDPSVDAGVERLDVAHVAAADEAALQGAADVVIATNTTIDTSTGTATPPIAAHIVQLDQEGGGRALLVIDARRIEIAPNATLRATGNRALVLVAAEEIVVAGVIDVSSNGINAGAGGYNARSGAGAGVNAIGINGFDTGASGAGHGAPGGAGGNESSMPIAGPAGGVATNTPQLAVLDGGSGGGRATPIPCGDGGAGGGAVQLTAPSIVIDGIVDAGGGGGQGGNNCTINGVTDASGGSGGGAGGAIYLQARDVSGTGILVANGGGGGGGGCRTCADKTGDNGEDGRRDAQPAGGGASPLDTGGGEARGGAGASMGTARAGNPGTNAGGGGGGPGRIFVASPVRAPSLRSSPALVE